MVATDFLVFVSGQVPTTLDAPVSTQTAEVLDKLDATLARAGSDKAHLLTATIYLRDFRDYAEMPGWKVEIVATALRASRKPLTK